MSDGGKRSRPAGLGRGLSALLGEMATEAPVTPGAKSNTPRTLSVALRTVIPPPRPPDAPSLPAAVGISPPF